MRLGHRESVDFDFFTHLVFEPFALAQSIAYLRVQLVTQQDKNTLSCDVGTEKGAVKMSFFGGLSLRQIDAPDRAQCNGIAVASLRDIFGMKCATVSQRGESKDYLDIHALMVRAGLSLTEGLGAAGAIFGRQYNPLLTLQALSYFDDLPEPLADTVKADLRAAVRSVSLQHLPQLVATHVIGEGA